MKHHPRDRTGGYYLWQLASYGKDLLDDQPCDVMYYRPMPCTPAGDFIATAATPADGYAMIDRLMAEDETKLEKELRAAIAKLHASGRDASLEQSRLTHLLQQRQYRVEHPDEFPRLSPATKPD
jgi:hypothetical protein